MILNTERIQDYIKLLSLVANNNTDDYIYLDSEHQKLYISNSSVASVLDIEVTAEPEDKVLVLSRTEFFHVVSNCNSLQIKNNYEYSTGTFQGIFHNNEEFSTCLSDIKEMFRNEKDFQKLLTIDTNLMKDISKASIFVNATDSNLASRGVHFIDNMIASSSLFRIFSKKLSVSMENPLFISSSILKFIDNLKGSYDLLKNDTMYLLKNDYVEIVFSDVMDVAPLPIKEDRYLQAIELLKNHSKLSFTIKDIMPKLDFLSFFVSSDKKKNGLTKMVLDKSKNVCYLKADENRVEIALEDDSAIQEDNEFFINLLVLKDILSKLEKDYVNKAYIYCDVTSKMIFVEIPVSEQSVLFSKINA